MTTPIKAEAGPAVTTPATGKPELADYEIVVAVCGGIAAFKTVSLVSALVQRGAGVSVAMTASAQRFITPLTFESLTARHVFTSLWESSQTHDPQHLKLTEAADLFVIAPATANIISKIAHGMADELVSTMVLSAACPVMLAPAMNTRMWQNHFVQQNVRALSGHGIHIIQPAEGWLACRTVGEGRMASPETILDEITTALRPRTPKKNQKPARPHAG